MKSVQKWLDKFSESTKTGNGKAVAALFKQDGLWRDYLAFDWTLQTVESASNIADFVDSKAGSTGFINAVFEGEVHETEGFIRFNTSQGKGRGYIRLENGLCTSLFTLLNELENVQSTPRYDENPFVLIIGGGQSGLALGAQLADTDVPYLIVDKHPCVGDQWRSRYDSLVLHDPVWYDHLPFVPFPEDWPIFTPKDKMGDWLESYAERLSLNIWTNTEFTGGRYDEAAGCWQVSLQKENEQVSLSPSHVVFALGNSGFPRLPTFKGQGDFKGQQFHSSAFKDGKDMAGQNVIIIGANNSAHDIAANLVENGATPTLIQRSSTLVVRQQDYCDKLIGSLYSPQALAQGITTDKADILNAATPLRQLEKAHRPIWDEIKTRNKAYYQRLTDAGFTIDFAEDGTGLGMKYRRTASGYYIDVGAAEMVMDGRIGVRSGVNVECVTEDGIRLDTGETLAADTIVYATGFGTMTDWVAALIDEQTAERVGPCWGYGSGTKGDPGPWIGELRNMWMPTAQEGLWFMGGNLAQVRFYSRLLALQLQGRFVS